MHYYYCRRLFTLMAGWGTETFTAGNYFFWIPMIVPYFGGILGGAVYTLMVRHPDQK